jgi:hypothetical protein
MACAARRDKAVRSKNDVCVECVPIDEQEAQRLQALREPERTTRSATVEAANKKIEELQNELEILNQQNEENQMRYTTEISNLVQESKAKDAALEKLKLSFDDLTNQKSLADQYVDKATDKIKELKELVTSSDTTLEALSQKHVETLEAYKAKCNEFQNLLQRVEQLEQQLANTVQEQVPPTQNVEAEEVDIRQDDPSIERTEIAERYRELDMLINKPIPTLKVPNLGQQSSAPPSRENGRIENNPALNPMAIPYNASGYAVGGPHVYQQFVVPAMTPNLQQGSSWNTQPVSYQVVAPSIIDPSGPTLSQIHMRDATEPLPKFDGNLREWLRFKRLYDSTTQACGFNDQENLSRLRSALKGNAMSLVGMMIESATAEQVMATLNEYYGDPDAQLNILVQDLRNVPVLKSTPDDNMEKLVNTLSHFVVSVKSLNRQNELNSHQYLNDVRAIVTSYTPLHKALNKVQEVPGTTLMEIVTEIIRKEWSLVRRKTLPSTQPVTSKQVHPPMENVRRVMLHYAPTETSNFVHADQESQSSQCSSDGEIKRCQVCSSEQHRIYKCPEFKSKTIDERRKLAETKSWCYRCLSTRHKAKRCRSRIICGVKGCLRRHNRLLHVDYDILNQQQNPQQVTPHQHAQQQPSQDKEQQQQQPGQAQQQANAAALSHARVENDELSGCEKLLAPILPVKLHGFSGRTADSFIQIDSATYATLMDRNLADELGLPGKETNISLKWTSGETKQRKAWLCSLEISGQSGKRYKVDNVYAVDNLELPKQSQNSQALAEEYPHLKGLKIPSYENKSASILIGLEHAKLISSLNTIEGEDDQPIAQRTRLGWCVYGKSSGTNARSSFSGAHIPVMLNSKLKVCNETVKSKPASNVSNDEINQDESKQPPSEDQDGEKILVAQNSEFDSNTFSNWVGE